MMINELVCKPDGTQMLEQKEVTDNFFNVPIPELTIEQRTTALEATQSDVIDILASALGVTI